MELDDQIYEQIEDLCASGDELIEEGRFDAAIKKYSAALDLLPLPKDNWEASTWIYTALGDAYYFKSDYKAASNYFYDAFNCPDGFSNPFILLRLGQCQYECGELSKAKKFLLQAYMLEGEVIFEDEDEKYSDLIKDLI